MNTQKIKCEAVTGTTVFVPCLKYANGYYEHNLANSNGKKARGYYCHVHGKGLTLIEKANNE